jgi:RNA polymerase sigma-54 factor
MYLRQEVSMRQDMVQTPQQILRSELLQLPVMLLEARLKLEVEENPALEFTEAELGVEDLREPGQEEDDVDDDRASDDVKLDEALQDEDNWDEFVNEDNLTPYGREPASQSTQELLDIPRPQIQTLQERLADQLQMDPALDYEDQRIGLEFIGNMGDSGYL